RDATFAVPFAAAHLGAAEAARDHDLDALRAGLHRALDGLLHRLLEGDAAGQLLADVGRDEVGVELRLTDLLDLQLDLALGQRADLLAQDLDVLAALADDDAGLGRVHGDRDLAEVALDLEAADARVGEPLLDERANLDVLGQERRVLLVVVPLGGPGARHPESEPVGVDFVSHVPQPSRSPTVTVMWVTPLWIGKARPWARGRQRLIVGPSSARASTTKSSSAERFRLFSAFAVALFRTPATSLAACWGMNRSRAAASSTERPRITATTSRALRVEPQT